MISILVFLAVLESSRPLPAPAPLHDETRTVVRQVVVRPGGGDPRRDRPERYQTAKRHPVSIFHRLVTRPLKRLTGEGAR